MMNAPLTLTSIASWTEIEHSMPRTGAASQTAPPFSQLPEIIPSGAGADEILRLLNMPVQNGERIIPTRNSLSRRLLDYVLKGKLGEGAFGSVFLAENALKRDGRAYVAIKVVRRSKLTKGAIKNLIFSEQNTLKYLTDTGCFFFPQLVESFVDACNYYLVMEFLGGGTLRESMINDRTRFTSTYIKFVLSQVVYAVDFLHKRGIIHRDIKPENILIDSRGHIVLTDLGLSRRFCHASEDMEVDGDGEDKMGVGVDRDAGYYNMTISGCGTPGYMAPEIIRGDFYSFKVDCWSLGCVLYEMLFGTLPFHGKNMKELSRAVLYNTYFLPNRHNVDLITLSFVGRLLAKQTEDRMDMGQAILHPFFHSVNWELVAKREYDLPGAWVPPTPDIDDNVVIDKKVLVEESSAYQEWDCSFGEFDFIMAPRKAVRSRPATDGEQRRVNVRRFFVDFISKARQIRERALATIRSHERANGALEGEFEEIELLSMPRKKSTKKSSQLSSRFVDFCESAYRRCLGRSAIAVGEAAESGEALLGAGHTEFSVFNSSIVAVEDYIPSIPDEDLVPAVGCVPDVILSTPPPPPPPTTRVTLEIPPSPACRNDIRQMGESQSNLLAIPVLVAFGPSPPATPLPLTPATPMAFGYSPIPSIDLVNSASLLEPASSFGFKLKREKRIPQLCRRHRR